jgi:hypothetical protein
MIFPSVVLVLLSGSLCNNKLRTVTELHKGAQSYTEKRSHIGFAFVSKYFSASSDQI